MTTFKLVVFPGGRAMLTTTRQLSPEMAEHLRSIIRDWISATAPFVAIIPDCEVVQVVELELEAAGPEGSAV